MEPVEDSPSIEMSEQGSERSDSPGCDDQLFNFPYAPTFEPTAEEFRDPTAYISKIRHSAERFGVCKIKPPEDWCPPFAADTEKFRFTPRVQQVTAKLARECPNCGDSKTSGAELYCCLCYDMYHVACLDPIHAEKYDDMWWCSRCVRGEEQVPQDATLSDQRYSLSQFGDMADKFKAEYFNCPPALVAAKTVEHDFWRLKSSLGEEVSVEFGDSLSSEEYASGFPRSHHRSDPPEIREYFRSPWNLHNLAHLENSVLHHVKEAQLHVPVVDVGMCFTTHGWVQAPHWLYTVSYLHWGEQRTWYVVPGESAEKFESFILAQTPPSPGAVTPEKLWEADFPVYRLEQNASEFVILFPRSYQLNFSHGFNFAECVLYGPPDWIEFGGDCEAYYSSKRRPNLFSHSEILCRMACSWPCLDSALRPAVFEDLKDLLSDHRVQVKRAFRKGVTNSSKEMMEAMPWGERRCAICHSICFLSAVTCVCDAERMVCLDHLNCLCDCDFSNYTLRYRYSDEEIPKLLSNLSSWVEELNTWQQKVAEIYKNATEKEDLEAFKKLFSEAQENQFPESDLYHRLKSTIDEATQLAELCSQLSNRKVRTRTHTTTDAKVKLSLEELTSLCGAVGDMACRIPEGDAVMSLLRRAENCRRQAVELLAQDAPDSSELEECSEQAGGLDIHFPEVSVLKQRMVQVEWLDEVNALRESPEQVTMYALRRLISIGIELPPHTRVEQALTELQVLLRSVEDWQERAKICLDVKCRQNINILESLLEEAKNIPAFLPNIQVLHNVLKKGKEWITKVDTMQKSDEYPYLDSLEKLVNGGRGIPLDLEQLPLLEQQVTAAKAWRDRTSRTFLRKNSLYTLMQALAPRTVVGVESLHTSKTLQQMQYQQLYQATDINSVDSATVVQVFKKAEIQEMMSMRELRAQNIQKRMRDPGNAVYCICRRGSHGFMLQCELCKDSFHASCVPLPKTTGSKARLLTPAQQIAAAASREVKFLCPCCLRSRRPRLETILSLLVTMHKVPVRLPEGDALKCLTERAMNWQDRARQTLATEELASALAKLSVLSQKLVEAAAREKTEKIISSELKKAASKPELGINMMAIRASHSSGVDKFYSNENDEQNTSFSNSEHAYSSASKSVQGACNSSGPPSNKGKGNMHGPLLSLSDAVRAKLEELMMEGDLLEVSLDETQHIWRILQATKPPQNFKYPDIDDIEHELMASQVERERMMHEHKKERRRKHSEMDMGMSYPVPPRKPRMSFPKEFDKIRRPRLKGMKKGFKRDMGPMRGPRKQGDGRPFQPRKGKRGTSDEDNDECSARPCLHPLEREVDWVQCDGGCELWFHLFCVGLDKRDVKEDEDFICRVCQARGAS